MCGFAVRRFPITRQRGTCVPMRNSQKLKTARNYSSALPVACAEHAFVQNPPLRHTRNYILCGMRVHAESEFTLTCLETRRKGRNMNNFRIFFEECGMDGIAEVKAKTVFHAIDLMKFLISLTREQYRNERWTSPRNRYSP